MKEYPDKAPKASKAKSTAGPPHEEMKPEDTNPYAAPRLMNVPRSVGALGWFAILLFLGAVAAYLIALVNLGTILAQIVVEVGHGLGISATFFLVLGIYLRAGRSSLE